MNELLTLSGIRLAELIKKKEITSVELTAAHIERIRQVNPAINAVVAERFNLALDEARAADRAVSEGRPGLPLFHGVPCTIKENIALAGMPNSCGLVSRKNVRPGKDATVVSRYRAAGAIPMGVTNVPEYCMWWETYNRIYGRTRNPYNRRRIAGGSSGGEGAIIGAGGSPFGIGSDIGGSVRMPAFFNGIFGHKPTGGMVPLTGQYPPVENNIRRYLTSGPLARRAEDLPHLLRAIAGPDGQDGGCIGIPLGETGSVKLNELTVFMIEDNGLVRVDDSLRQAMDRCGAHLRTMGAIVKKIYIRELKYSMNIWLAMLSREEETPVELSICGGKKMNLFAELMKMAVGASDYTLPVIALVIMERLSKLAPAMMERFADMGPELRAKIEAMIGEKGVILYPPYTETAPPHRKPLLFPLDASYTMIVNVLEFPATQAPLGLDRRGLPLGVQVISRAGNDHVTIAVAQELERAFGGWVPPWHIR